jgi:ribose transport system permease protein
MTSSSSTVADRVTPAAPGSSPRPLTTAPSQRVWLSGERMAELGLLAGWLVLVLALALTEERFRTQSNAMLILDQAAPVLLIAIPFSMLLMARHIDLSVGSSLGFTAVVGSHLLAGGTNVALACAAIVGLAAAIGALNGVLCTYMGFQPIVATLGMLGVLRGAALMAGGDAYATGFPHEFRYIGQGWIRYIDVPVSVAIAFVTLVVALAYYYRTRHGRHARAIGGNPNAAFLSGIKINRVALSLYVATGVGVGLAALVSLSQLDSGPPTTGTELEITVLTAVLLGGVAFDGGRGSLLGVVLGTLFIYTLSNGFTQWGFSTDEVRLVNGAVLVFAAGLQAVLHRGNGGSIRVPRAFARRSAPTASEAGR